MKPKMTAISVLFLLCSVVLFPLFAIGGMLALFVWAASIEGLRMLPGVGAKRVELSAARSTAMRICYGRLHHS